MSYFLAIDTPFGKRKALSRYLYPTRTEARDALRARQREAAVSVADRMSIQDADHEPGRSILTARHGFA